MQKLRVNDEVILLAGKDKGKKGKVKQIFPKANRVIVEGINMVKKAIRPKQNDPTSGGIVSIEGSVHRSNVALVDPKTGRATRVRIGHEGDKKVRIAVKSGTALS